MTKWQKVWLSIGIAMFAIPEILWSPVVNFAFEWSQKTNHVVPLRSSFLTDIDNIDRWSAILLIQAFGFMLIFFWVIYSRKFIKNKILFWVFLILSFFLTTYIFYMYKLSTIRLHF